MRKSHFFEKSHKIIKTVEKKTVTGRERKTQIEFEMTIASEIKLHQKNHGNFMSHFALKNLKPK